MTYRNYQVNLTSPWRLLVLIMSSIGIFGLTLFVFKLIHPGLLGLAVALTNSIILFVILKRKVIQKTTISLSKNDVQFTFKSIKLKDINYYKTHRMRGAGLKIKMKNGEIINLSCNDNFCNGDEFVRFVNDFENLAKKIPEIQKEKTLGETKFGLYFAITMTTVAIAGIAYQLFAEKEVLPSKFLLIIVSLSTLWSGIEIKKHLPTPC